MTTTLSNGTTTLTPTVVLGWNSEQPTRTQIHPIIGASIPDITTRPALKRSGTLEVLFASETDAESCRTMHTAAGVFELASTDLDTIDMSYVVAGSVKLQLDDTITQWIVTIGYQEV